MPETSRETTWDARRSYWQRRLRRLVLDAEPIEEQLARYRRATWGLTVAPLVMGSILVALFTAFGAPAIGLTVAGLLMAPIVAFAWLDDWRLRRTAAAYQRERRAFEARGDSAPGG